MQRRTANCRSDRGALGAAWHAALAAAAIVAGAALSGCSSTGGDTLTVFADPGKYQYHSCEQIANERKSWTTRQHELQLLMDKADQSAGGAVVNALAYKADQVAANEELRVLDNTARAKNCETPANWKSNSSVK
jgi:hypothetical protein